MFLGLIRDFFVSSVISNDTNDPVFMSPVACKELNGSDSFELYYVGEYEDEDDDVAVSCGQCSSSFPYSKDNDSKINTIVASDDA